MLTKLPHAPKLGTLAGEALRPRGHVIVSKNAKPLCYLLHALSASPSCDSLGPYRLAARSLTDAKPSIEFFRDYSLDTEIGYGLVIIANSYVVEELLLHSKCLLERSIQCIHCENSIAIRDTPSPRFHSPRMLVRRLSCQR